MVPVLRGLICSFSHKMYSFTKHYLITYIFTFSTSRGSFFSTSWNYSRFLSGFNINFVFTTTKKFRDKKHIDETNQVGIEIARQKHLICFTRCAIYALSHGLQTFYLMHLSLRNKFDHVHLLRRIRRTLEYCIVYSVIHIFSLHGSRTELLITMLNPKKGSKIYVPRSKLCCQFKQRLVQIYCVVFASKDTNWTFF